MQTTEIDLSEFDTANPVPPTQPARTLGTPATTVTLSAPPDSQSRSRNEPHGIPQPLYGDRAPQYDRAREKPEHRIMILLKATGLSNVEIAAKTGFSNTTVNDVLRQPWARRLLLDELHGPAEEEIDKLLRGELTNSVFRLIDIRDNPVSKGSDVIAASREILDRALGKPIQKVEQKNVDKFGSTDVAEMQRKLDELRREETRLTGDATATTVSNS